CSGRQRTGRALVHPSGRPSPSWPSMPRRPGCSASPCRRRSSPPPTRRLSELLNLLHPLRSGNGRYCCKSPKLHDKNFPAKRRSDRRSPIYVEPISLLSGDEVPHIFTRKSRLQPGEFLITSAKRLLQQYRHETDVLCVPTNVCS